MYHVSFVLYNWIGSQVFIVAFFQFTTRVVKRQNNDDREAEDRFSDISGIAKESDAKLDRRFDELTTLSRTKASENGWDTYEM